MVEDIFRGGEGDVLSTGPGEDAIEKGVFGDGTVVGAAAGDEPNVNAVGDHILYSGRFRLGAVLLKKIEGGAGRGNGVHFGIGEKSPAVPVGRGIHRTDVGETDAKGIIEGGGCVESGITAGAAADSRKVVDNNPTLLRQLLEEMIGGDVLFIHAGVAGTVAEENDGIGMVSFEVLENVRITQPVGSAVSSAIIENKGGVAGDIGRDIKETFGIPVDGTVGISFVWFDDQGIIE